jgi:anti-anti-sigma regulatory factor
MPNLPDASPPDASPPDDRSLVLPAHGSTVTAEDLRVRLVLASDFDGAMAVDASAVESVGQAVLQLLVAAKAEADAQGQSFSISNPSPAFVDRVTACGLAAAIGLSGQEEHLS